MSQNTTIAWLTVLLLATTLAASAAPVQFTLDPGPVTIGFRAYGLGIIRIDGQFTRFTGTLTLDDKDPRTCSVALRAEAASLRMPQQSMTDDALGPDLLDVAHFPDFRIDGQCEADQFRGNLLLHGITHPIQLQVSAKSGTWQASGLIRRAEWGMSARPLLAGPEVRVSITAGLPANFRNEPPGNATHASSVPAAQLE